MNGIDVSKWQPDNITDLVDYDFAIIKATEGTGYVSSVCDQQYQAAKRRGKLLGVYHYALGGDPVTESNFFVNNIKGYLGEAVLVLDYEANATKRGREWVRSFLKRVKELTEVNVVLYVSRSVYDTQNLAGILKDENCGLWLAAYPHTNPTGYYDPGQQRDEIIRQYSSTGRLNGYNGNLDLNRAYIDANKWRLYAKGERDGNTPTPQPDPVPAKKSNEEIATEVINGKWGDGNDRKKRLSDAGYDAASIQKIVNDRLGISQHTYRQYKVQKNDTLSAIAKRFGTTVQHLADLNGIANPNFILVGQKLCIDGGAAPASAPKKRTYTVQRGDTTSGIAKKLGIKQSQISGFRSGNPNLIYPDEVLTIN